MYLILRPLIPPLSLMNVNMASAAGPVSGWWLPIVTVSAVMPGVLAVVSPPLLPVPQPLASSASAAPAASPVSGQRRRCGLLMMPSLLQEGWTRRRPGPGALGAAGWAGRHWGGRWAGPRAGYGARPGGQPGRARGAGPGCRRG